MFDFNIQMSKRNLWVQIKQNATDDCLKWYELLIATHHPSPMQQNKATPK